MGPEKKRLFDKIDILTSFLYLKEGKAMQTLWKDFIVLVNLLSVSSKPNPLEFDKQAKQWVNNFKSVYQQKDITLYSHCLAMHTCISQFLTLHGNIGMLTQQG